MRRHLEKKRRSFFFSGGGFAVTNQHASFCLNEMRSTGTKIKGIGLSHVVLANQELLLISWSLFMQCHAVSAQSYTHIRVMHHLGV